MYHGTTTGVILGQPWGGWVYPVYPAQPQRCPNCGSCPHCGQYLMPPVWPYYYGPNHAQPYIPAQPYVYGDILCGGTDQLSSRNI